LRVLWCLCTHRGSTRMYLTVVEAMLDVYIYLGGMVGSTCHTACVMQHRPQGGSARREPYRHRTGSSRPTYPSTHDASHRHSCMLLSCTYRVGRAALAAARNTLTQRHDARPDSRMKSYFASTYGAEEAQRCVCLSRARKKRRTGRQSCYSNTLDTRAKSRTFAGAPTPRYALPFPSLCVRLDAEMQRVLQEAVRV